MPKVIADITMSLDGYVARTLNTGSEMHAVERPPTSERDAALPIGLSDSDAAVSVTAQRLPGARTRPGLDGLL